MTSRRNFLLAAGAGLLTTGGAALAGTSEDDMNSGITDPKSGLALALGGGAAKAFAHIPYLESLDSLGLRPAQVSGTSMGSILGALYCSGMSGRDIRNFVRETFNDRQRLLKKLLVDSGDTWGSLFNMFRPAVIEPEVLFEAILPASLPARIEALPTPLIVVATDFYKQSEHVMTSGPLISAIAASSTLPVLLTPVKRDNRVLIDGGFVNPTPFNRLDSERYMTIAIDVTGAEIADTGDIPTSFQTWTGSLSITQHSIVVEQLRYSHPDLFIAPGIGRFNPMDFFKIDAILAVADSEQDQFKRDIAALMHSNAK